MCPLPPHYPICLLILDIKCLGKRRPADNEVSNRLCIIHPPTANDIGKNTTEIPDTVPVKVAIGPSWRPHEKESHERPLESGRCRTDRSASVNNGRGPERVSRPTVVSVESLTYRMAISPGEKPIPEGPPSPYSKPLPYIYSISSLSPDITYEVIRNFHWDSRREGNILRPAGTKM